MSPRIVTFRPAIFPFRSRIVKASSRAWVGCSCAPSPALMMLDFTTRDRNCAAPDPYKIPLERLAIPGPVLQGLALFEGRALPPKIPDIRRQPLLGQFK